MRTRLPQKSAPSLSPRAASREPRALLQTPASPIMVSPSPKLPAPLQFQTYIFSLPPIAPVRRLPGASPDYRDSTAPWSPLPGIPGVPTATNHRRIRAFHQILRLSRILISGSLETPARSWGNQPESVAVQRSHFCNSTFAPRRSSSC